MQRLPSPVPAAAGDADNTIPVEGLEVLEDTSSSHTQSPSPYAPPFLPPMLHAPKPQHSYIPAASSPIHPSFTEDGAEMTICQLFCRKGLCEYSTCRLRHFLTEEELGVVTRLPPSAEHGNMPICQAFARQRCDIQPCQFRHFLTDEELVVVAKLGQLAPVLPRQPEPQTTRTTDKPCLFYQQGKCKNGSECHFLHDRVGPTQGKRLPCKFFATNSCSNGEFCPYAHDTDSSSPVFSPARSTGRVTPAPHPSATLSSRGSSPRPTQPSSYGWGEQRNDAPRNYQWGGQDRETERPRKSFRSCRYYAEGKCHKGDRCTFLHETPERPQEITENAPALAPPSSSTQEDAATWASSGVSDPWGESGVKDHWGSSSTSEPQPSSWSEPDPSPQIEAKQDDPPPKKYARWSDEVDDNEEDPWEGARSDHEDEVSATKFDPEPETEPEYPPAPDPTDDQATWETAKWDPNEKPPDPEGPVKVFEPCKFFGQGNCVTGDRCIFLHLSPGQDTDVRMQPTGDAEEAPEDTLVDDTQDLQPVTDGFFYCGVEYDSFLVPKSVSTPFDSTSFTLSNIPVWADFESITALCEPFGTLKHSSLDINPSGISANIGYSTPSEALAAANHLNNFNYEGKTLSVEFDAAAPVKPNVDHTQSCTVKVGWKIATISAWAHYKGITAAKGAVKRLNGTLFEGRKVEAEFERRPRAGQHTFSMQMRNLPADATIDALKKFSGADMITLSKPSYTESPVGGIVSKLKEFGDVEHLDVVDTDKSATRALAFTRFESRSTAELAARTLNGREQKSLANLTIWVEPVISTKYFLLSEAREAVKGELDRLRDTEAGHVRYYTASTEADVVSVRVYGTDRVKLIPLQMEVEMLVHGEVLRDPDNSELVLWGSYFDTANGSKALEHTNRLAKGAFHVICDFRNRHLRVFGNESGRTKAKTKILGILKKLQETQSVIPLKDDALPALLRGGLQAIYDAGISENRLQLDFVGRSLLVRGTPDTLDLVLKKLHEAISNLSASSENILDLCTLCACHPPAGEAIKLKACGHVYCRSCLQLFLRSRIYPGFISLTCLAVKSFPDPEPEDEEETEEGEKEMEGLVPKESECGAPFPQSVIRFLLSEEERRGILESSFIAYINRSSEDYRFCPITPYCQMVYRVGGAGATVQCPGCQSWVCISCHTGVHEGVGCVERQELLTTQ